MQVRVSKGADYRYIPRIIIIIIIIIIKVGESVQNSKQTSAQTMLRSHPDRNMQ